MKKVSVMLMTLAVAASVLTSCQKEEQRQAVKFTAAMEPCADIRNTKTILDGEVLKWENGDQIKIFGYGDMTGAIYSADLQEPAAITTFSYVSGVDLQGPNYYAVYPASIAVMSAGINLPTTQTSTDGSLRGFPMVAMAVGTTNLEFYNLCGVLKINLYKPGKTITSITLTVDNSSPVVNGRFVTDFANHTLIPSIANPGTHTVTLECNQSIDQAHDFYIYLPAGTYSGLQLEIAASDGTVCTKGPAPAGNNVVIERSKYSTLTLTEDDLEFSSLVPEGALPGKFTINANGGQVWFSQGNLQYQASTSTRRFAEHQYDYVGIDNQYISANYTGWIDLFGWGTGNNPTNTSMNNGNYQNFTNWGVNPISNGGNEANAWRTLTNSEWGYLINTRANTTNLGTANARYAKGTVNNVNGLIIFPDGYTHPTNVSTPSGINNLASGWSTNSYTATDWAAMESAGAVFLPAAKYRNGTSYTTTSMGYYWSASPDGRTNAYSLVFSEAGVSISSNYKHFGYSVRLVRNLERTED